MASPSGGWGGSREAFAGASARPRWRWPLALQPLLSMRKLKEKQSNHGFRMVSA